MKTLSILSLSVFFSMASFADEPAKPADSADKPAAVDTSTAKAGAAAAPAAASTQASPEAAKAAADQDAEAKKMRSMGYKPKHVGSQTLWCKKEAKLGTHFETENCMSADVAIARQHQDKEWAEKVQHTIPPSAK